MFVGLILQSLYFRGDINYLQVSNIFMNPQKAYESLERL